VLHYLIAEILFIAMLFPTVGLSQDVSVGARCYVPLLRAPIAFPSPQQRKWQDLGLGMFIHFAPNTWQDREYDDLSTPLSAMNPDKLDTDQWVDTAVKMGAKYIVFVAKHVGGFCMWQTGTTDYCIGNTPWRGGKGDVMADLAASCRKRGIKLGIYLSPQDRKQGAGTGGRCKTAEEQQAYNALYRRQLTELLTGYGPIVEIWFDGSQVVPVGDILQKYAPGAMIFQGPHATIRWVGNELGFAPYPAWNAVSARDAKTGIATAIHGDPDGDTWLPNEVDVSLRRPNWFWSTTNQTHIMTVDELIEIYYRSVGRGANLLLNLTPDRSGLIPAADVARVREFGDEVRRRFGKSIAETRAESPTCSMNISRNCGVPGEGNTIELRLKQPTRVDHVILQEDISQGERVREYVLEALTKGEWVSLGGGTAIGQMRIQPFEPRTIEAVRLTCTRALAAPVIRRLSLFATNSAPPKTWNAPAQVWADDAAGSWTNGKLEFDISKKIDAAAQYRLRFVPENGDTFSIHDAEILLDGIAQPHLLRPEKGRSDALILTMPGVGQGVRVRARIQGAQSGVVLLQKI
jgi:alpha-L-fucosidase